MEISLVVAKVLGTYFIISGVFLLFRGKTLAAMIKDLFDHPAILYITGAMLVILSSLFLVEHNTWDGTWRTIITLFAWATLLKGTMYILAPEVLHKMVTKKLLDSISVYGVVIVAVGLSLFYVG